jgi:hypothetical protein
VFSETADYTEGSDKNLHIYSGDPIFIGTLEEKVMDGTGRKAQTLNLVPQ